MKTKFDFSFQAKIEKIEGVYRSFGVIVPDTIIEQLPNKGRFRTQGLMNQVPFNLAIQNSKIWGKYFVISSPFLKSLKAKEGDFIDIEFSIVSSDLLEIPEELLVCLEQDEEANKLFSDFTKGLQRSLVHYVSSAKSIDTRIKRSLELLTKIKSRSLSVQKQEKDKGK